MTELTSADLGHYLKSFARFENGAGGPEWLRAVRGAARDRFVELGFPTPRDEDWKFTNVAPIARREFELAAEDVKLPSEAELAGFGLTAAEAERVVFVNGRYVSALSHVEREALPEGVIVGSLAEALEKHTDLVKAELSQHLDYEGDFFSALNTAFMEDGGFVYVPRGVVLERPIQLLFVTTETSQPIAIHPRNLIIVGEQGQASIVEEYVSLGEAEYFSNVATEVVAGDGAVVEHYRIERESTAAYNVGTVRVQQGRSTNVACHAVMLGGALVRNNVHPVLAGEGGECVISGLFMPSGRQHIDNFMRVEHASPHCNSRQFYTGILDGKSRGVFSGRIIVHEDAQKTDAKQTNRNLLLSADAQVDSNPQLEIYADDVKCTHGSTIGQLDANAIFYLRARGISEETARALLLFGFAGETLKHMGLASVRKYVEALIADRLPQGRALQALR